MVTQKSGKLKVSTCMKAAKKQVKTKKKQVKAKKQVKIKTKFKLIHHEQLLQLHAISNHRTFLFSL